MPSWPHLLVADSTTQWLLLLKQSSVSSLSCCLPLASSHFLFSMSSVYEYFFPHTCANPGLITSWLAVIDFCAMTAPCQKATDLLIDLPSVFTTLGQRPECLPKQLIQLGLVSPSLFPSQTRPFEFPATCGLPCQTGRRMAVLKS